MCTASYLTVNCRCRKKRAYYKQAVSLKRCVFNFFLKHCVLSVFLMSTGSLFHTASDECVKALIQVLMSARLACSVDAGSLTVGDVSACLDPLADCCRASGGLSAPPCILCAENTRLR